jgi:hypothetical protein
MKIEPINEIIPLKIDSPQIEENLHRLSLLLEEVRDFGSIIIAEIFKDDKGINEYVRSVISCFLRDIVEDIDAISVLINKSISDPCFLHLRRIFENCIYLKFILKEKSKERAMAYRVNNLLNKRKQAEREDPSTNAWKRLKEEMEKDELLSKISIPTIDRKSEMARIDGILQKQKYLYIKNEFDRLKKRGESRVHWYSLFGGKNNLAQLSESIGCSGIYNYYRYYSQFAHNETALDNLDSTGPEEAGLIQIRNPEHAQDIIQTALHFALYFFRIVLETLKPQLMTDYTRFYIENIYPHIIELTKTNVINVIR